MNVQYAYTSTKIGAIINIVKIVSTDMRISNERKVYM